MTRDTTPDLLVLLTYADVCLLCSHQLKLAIRQASDDWLQLCCRIVDNVIPHDCPDAVFGVHKSIAKSGSRNCKRWGNHPSTPGRWVDGIIESDQEPATKWVHSILD